MKIETYLPTDQLKPFIKTFLIIESERGMENNILPNLSIVLAFRFKGNITYTEGSILHHLPLSAITGLRKSARLLDYASQTATLLVLFREGGAAALFKEPLHELFGMSVALDYLIPARVVEDIEEQLAEAKTNGQRIAIIEQFLLAQRKERTSDRLILQAVQQIKSAKGAIRIQDVIANLPVSRDPFEKRFRRLVGTSPKQFSAIVRLRNLIDHYPQAASLTEAAHTAGYFDQSHFIKDFRLFTGQTPKDFFKSASYW